MTAKALFLIGAALALSPWMPAGGALVLGLVLALSLGNPWSTRTRALTHPMLQLAVVGLGAGVSLKTVAEAGARGFGYTVLGIGFTLLAGQAIRRALRADPDSSLLITVGTAICGGSAIAAMAPVIRAKHHDVSVALGTVFMLNAVGLLLFPPLGHRLGLSEAQFGLWSALAIHDTSSVVGASMQFGPRALEIGTTVKLARALWIVPLTFAVGALRARGTETDGTRAKRKLPWFILGFVALAALVTYLPVLQPAGHVVEYAARRVLVLTLFLIGSNLNRDALRTVGIKPFVLGIALWILVATGTLIAIDGGWIAV